MRAAAAAYTREFGLAMAAYVVGVVASRLLLPIVDPALRPAVALIPVVPALFPLAAYLRFLSRADELAQRIQLVSLASALGVVGFATFSYGLLEENAGFPHVPLLWVFPAMIAVWGIATVVASRRYR